MVTKATLCACGKRGGQKINLAPNFGISTVWASNPSKVLQFAIASVAKWVRLTSWATFSKPQLIRGWRSNVKQIFPPPLAPYDLAREIQQNCIPPQVS
jgi:hypothetical protein